MIRSRKDEKPQSVKRINFLNPKSPKSFAKKLKDWLRKVMS